ncbi:MAG: LysM peptidoglycan-binding domain-containing protein [Candidatus Omnitrophota bacterium]
MKTLRLICALSFLLFVLSGCVVRTYNQVRDRIDQDLSGNQGYIQGKVPAQETTAQRPTTRTTRVVEIELHSPLKFDKNKPTTVSPAITPIETMGIEAVTEEAPAVVSKAVRTYKVQKNDTLQKISQKLFGTTKKWTKIYNANRDKLSNPSKIYPGQVLIIPKD